MSLAPGAKLGPYEIIAPIGAGGMGEVFKARDTRLGRIVAIKTLPADKVADPVRKQRFLQEAQAASSLNHPNIITIHDFLEQSGDHLVMEFVAGKTLEQAIPRKGLRIQEVLKYAVQIADALAAAHAAGIVHRDIKPANILISDDGRVKVADFGLAKLTEAGPAGEDNPTLTQRDLTEAGTVVGSAAYMSPEQAEGKKVDARTDIFSFGAVLYEMLTGQGAFRKDSRAATIAAVLREEPKPARELVDELPKELDRIVSRCLRKDLDRRSHSMAEIKLALEEIRDEWESGTATTSQPAAGKPSLPNRKLAAAGLIALTAAVAGGVWIEKSRHGTAPVAYRMRQITRGEGVNQEPALSPDGKLIAYSSDRAQRGNFDIWVQQVEGGEPVRITKSPRSEAAPMFSPDGTKILFQRRGEGIFEVPALGGSERLIANQTGPYPPRYSPDGKWIAVANGYYSTGATLNVYPTSGGSPRQPRSPSEFYGQAVWLSDSQRMLAWHRGPGTNKISVVSLEGREPVETNLLSAVASKGLDASWQTVSATQAGDLIVAAKKGGGSSNIWKIPLNSSGTDLRSEPERLTAGSGEYPGPSSQDGRYPFVNGDTQRTIYSVAIEPNLGKVSGELERTVQGSGTAYFPTISTDGKRMVYVSDRSGNFDIWTKTLPDGEEKLLFGTAYIENRGLLSPDATRVAIQQRQGGQGLGLLYSMATGTVTKVCDDCQSLLGWTPDSKRIILADRKQDRLRLLEVDSGRQTPLLAHPKFATHAAAISPDGRWVAFKLVVSNSVQPVYIAPIHNDAAGTEAEWIKIGQDEFHSSSFWSPDGNLLYYHRPSQSLLARRLDPVTRQPRGDEFVVLQLPGNLSFSSTPFTSHSGLTRDRLYVALEATRSDIWIAEPDKPNP